MSTRFESDDGKRVMTWSDYDGPAHPEEDARRGHLVHTDLEIPAGEARVVL